MRTLHKGLPAKSYGIAFLERTTLGPYFINKPNLDRLARSLSKTYKIFAPAKSGNNRFYKKIGEDGLGDSVIGEIRPVEPIKSFYFPARTKIAEYFSKGPADKAERPIAIIGAKSFHLPPF